MPAVWAIAPRSARLIGECPSLPERSIMDMQDNSQEITRRQFLSYVRPEDMKEAEKALGYDRDFRMAGDWHVSYHRAVFEGKSCVYFVHSHIEWVFA